MRLKELVSIAGIQYSVMGINFLLQLILTLILSPNIFGVYAKIYAIRDITIALTSLNLSVTIIYLKTKVNKALITTSIYLGLAQGIVLLFISIILVIILRFIFKYSWWELVLLEILLSGHLLTIMYQIFYSVYEKQEYFKFNSILNLIAYLVSTPFVLTIAFTFKDIKSLVIKDLLPAVLLFIIYTIRIIRSEKIEIISLKHFDKQLAKEMIKYSSKIYISRLSEALYSRIDIIIGGKLFDTTSLGIYERVKYFAMLPQTLLTSLIYRINFVKYSKSTRVEDVQRTNSVAFISNIIIFTLMYFVLKYVGVLFHNKLYDSIFPLFFLFWLYAGPITIIENIKTYYYAINNVIKATFIFRLVPTLIFCLALIIYYHFYNPSIFNFAMILSISFSFPLILLNREVKKFKFHKLNW